MKNPQEWDILTLWAACRCTGAIDNALVPLSGDAAAD
jgi:hypothetical protein